MQSIPTAIPETNESAEARANMLALCHISQGMGKIKCVAEAASVILKTVREAFGWTYGSYFELDPCGEELIFKTASGEAHPSFTAATQTVRFRPGVGMVGTAWRQREVVSIPDVRIHPQFMRAGAASAAGLITGTALAVEVAGQVVGVMEMFSNREAQVTEVGKLTMKTACLMLGHALERIAESERRLAEEREISHRMAIRVEKILATVNLNAEGDLRAELVDESTDAMGQVTRGLTTLVQGMRASMLDIHSHTLSVASAAEQLSTVSQTLESQSLRSSEAADEANQFTQTVIENISAVAVASEEMSSCIGDIAKNAQQAASVSAAAVARTVEANSTVAQLGSSSKEIGKVIRVISAVAQQTHLLSLNAMIEAARAGEAGKGFAVVAHEVKELARTTAQATEDITQKIETIQHDSARATEAICGINEIIGEISGIASSIASAVEQQSATTREISARVASAARDAGGAGQVIGRVAVLAEEGCDAAGETLSASRSLAILAGQLQTLVTRFKV